MENKLGAWNTFSLGMMVFCFFLGAGNLIFPPMAGLLAGTNLPLAAIGFLFTAVGMPLLGLLAIAKVGGGIVQLARHLPSTFANAIALTIYLVLVPLFGIPRTCLVAYELGLIPFVEDPNQLSLLLFSVFYFASAMFFILRPGRLIDTVGKVLTPVLAICLAYLCFSVIQAPFAEVAAPQGSFATMPLGQGFIDGYNTMDALAALMFGVLMIEALKSKGVTQQQAQFSYMVKASVIAAMCLTLLYLALFYLGATASGLNAQAQNGGGIIVAYVGQLFGSKGQLLLAIIVSLACVSTAIGGISSFANYIASTGKLSYKTSAWLALVACALVANVGLNQLLLFSLPILVGIYPVAIVLVLFNLLISWFKAPQMAARLVISVAVVFGVLDGLAAAGLDMQAFHLLPGFEQGFAWLFPSVLAFVIASGLGRKPKTVLKPHAS